MKMLHHFTEGLEHPWISVFTGGPGTYLSWILRDDCPLDGVGSGVRCGYGYWQVDKGVVSLTDTLLNSLIFSVI